jgi:putative spermidine/putrescine transport system ATP-binding protein
MSIDQWPAEVDRPALGNLELISLEKRFGDVPVVAGLDLKMGRGEFVTVLGPSGSGKTTTLAMLAGLVPVTSGQVILDGLDITRVPVHKRNMGVVFQNYALFPHMTVERNVGYPLRMRRVGGSNMAKRVAEAIELVHLGGYEGRYPRELSGGQQQRVAFARAVVYGPPVLLMDEPLSALDRSLREDMQREIRRLHRELGKSILYVTHDQDEALSLSDRVVVMRQGVAEQIGTPEEVYERPRTEFVAKFLGESNFLVGDIVEAHGDGKVVVKLSTGTAVTAISPTGMKVSGQALLSIRPENLALTTLDGVASRGPTLRVIVRETTYRGHRVTCRGQFETGAECVFYVTAGQLDVIERQRDREVTLTWNPEHCTVVQPST